MMDGGLMQSLAAGMIVLAAGGFLGRRAWRTIRSAKRSDNDVAACGPGGACGCSGSAVTPRDANTIDTYTR